MRNLRHPLQAALCIMLGGCVALPGINLSPPSGATSAGKQDADIGPKKLSTLSFEPLSDETAQKLGLFASSSSGYSGGAVALGNSSDGSAKSEGTQGFAAQPAVSLAGTTAVAPSAGMSAPGGLSISPYAYQTYFPGPFGMMRLESVTEAVAAGASGTFKSIQDKVAVPVLAEWSADANLVDTNASVDENGELALTQEAFPGQYGWRFTYAASDLREVLMFLVTPRETRVLRFRWVPVAIDPRSIAVDTSDAIAKVVAAIKDPTVKTKEEELGRDYFFNPADYPRPMSGPMDGVGISKGIPGAPPNVMPMPSAMPVRAFPSPGPMMTPPPNMPTPPPFYFRQEVKEEPITQLKAGGRWSISLQPITKFVVWNLNYSYYETTPAMAYKPEPMRYEEPKEGTTTSWESYYVNAMIDARTGDLIRLSRPKRYTSVTVKVPVDYQSYPYGYPYGSPLATGDPLLRLAQ